MIDRPDPLNLVICGVGGQGNILISRLLGRVLSQKGYLVNIGETFGAAQRGGPVYSNLRVSRRNHYGPLTPEGRGHYILSLEPLEALRSLSLYGNPGVIVVSNSEPYYPVGVLSRRLEYPDLEKLKAAVVKLSQKAAFVDATAMALGLGAPIAANIIMLGALIGGGLDLLTLDEMEAVVEQTFPGEKGELNLKALRMGFEAV